MSTMTEVKERPILMSAPMVRALLSGAKTMTRRPVKPQPPATAKGFEAITSRPEDYYDFVEVSGGHDAQFLRCPYGRVGERLWVKETWAIDQCGPRVSLDKETWSEGWPLSRLRYVATDEAPSTDRSTNKGYWWNKRSSMFMPRWASRITLEITGVRVERLQDISEADAIAEGVLHWGANMNQAEAATAALFAAVSHCVTKSESVPIWLFHQLWESINGDDSWKLNPWLWVVEFKRLEPK
jgi:hypothetical protein